MAGEGEDDKEYESDPEEAKMSLKMRRREASDDEEGEGADDVGDADGEVEGRREKPIPPVARAVLDSEGESDGQGAAGEYDDDESDFEVEEEYYDEEEGEEEMEGEYVQERGGDGLKPTGEEVLPEGEGDMLRSAETGESSELRGEDGVAAGQTKEENKENEPFAVPRAGAFYMHDDRFGDNAGARHSRRTFAGRKLWESKDDKKWRHDKFEELNPHGRQYQQWRKSSRGRSWGRGRGRGMGRAHAEGNNWPKTYSYDNQTVAAKHVRGRGPSRYRPLTKHRDNVLPQDTQTVKPLNRTSRTSSARAGISSSYKEPEPFPSNRVASNLSSASPPFYPSASSKEFGVNRKGAQTGNQNRSARPSVVGDKLPKQPPSSSVRGKNVVDTMGIEKFSVNDASSRPLANLHAPHSLSTNASQASHPRDQSRGLSVSGSNSFASPSLSQFNKGRPSAQVHTANQNPAQAQEKRTLPASTHALGLQPGNVSQGPSHAVSGLAMSPLESRDKVHCPESSNSRAALVGKGKGSIQVGGQASFVYSGSQVIGSTGAMGSGHADPNFPGAPTFLPVMQFGAQHPGGIGVPAMGMAFPGYVANPQMGLGNSEMTWLPVLAGAAGALGATYCPPYMAVDGGHHVRPVGQAPSALAISSKDSNADRPNNERKPRLKSEVVTDELSQRQSKPRRYSEMSFGQ